MIGRARIETLRVPCEFRVRDRDGRRARSSGCGPRSWSASGRRAGATGCSIERVAINVDDARSADNAGSQPVDEPIAPSGPAAYFATLPIKAMAQAVRAAGVPAEVSNTAGTYVCNHLLYGVLHFLAASGAAARAGFIHVPYAEAQVLDKPGMPSMALASMVRGVEAAVVAALEHATDVKIPEGREQ